MINYQTLILDITNAIVLSYLFLNFKKFNKKDLIIICIVKVLVCLYFSGRIFKNKKIFEIFHLAWAIAIIILPIITDNTCILLPHFIVVLITILTRRIFRVCMLRQLEEKDSKITNNSFTKKLNWNIIFPITYIYSAIKLSSRL